MKSAKCRGIQATAAVCRQTLRTRGQDPHAHRCADRGRGPIRLEKDVAADRFRETYYGSMCFRAIAPLRERKEDIPLLAQHFIKLSAKEWAAQTG